MLADYFKTGVWVGEGVLRLSMFEEPLPMKAVFYIAPLEAGSQEISLLAEYRVAGYRELILNYYNFTSCYKATFTALFENLEWGKVEGKGFFEKNHVGIEYPHNHAGFQGFESYEFSEDSFHLTQQYTIGDGVRSEGEVTLKKKVPELANL